MISEVIYKARNLKGFEGDNILKDTISEIIKRRKIDLVIETGTYLGGTAKKFSEMVNYVITIEKNVDFFNKAKDFLSGCNNVAIHNDDSPNKLNSLLKHPFIQEKNILFFLDAHWEQSCPLKKELFQIYSNKLKPVIIIHDWKVPGTDFGYDSYNGQPFTYEWIKEDIEKIYRDKYIHYYNKQAEGAKRGVIFIESI